MKKTLFPITEGVKLSNTPLNTLWTKLENCAIRDGLLCHRPGFNFLNPAQFATAMPAGAVQQGVPVAIYEIENPGSSSTGREGYAFEKSTRVPDNTATVVAGWSGTHADIDDSGDPDGNEMTSSTQGAMVSFAWSSDGASGIDTISGLVFRGIWRRAGDIVKVKFYWRSGSTNYLLKEFQIYVEENAESAAYEYFCFDLPYHPIRKDRITTNDVLALEAGSTQRIAMELSEVQTATSYTFKMNADGMYTQWYDWANDDPDGTRNTAVYTDFDGSANTFWTHLYATNLCTGEPFTVGAGNNIYCGNQLFNTTTGLKQSWTYGEQTIDNLSSISSIDFKFHIETEIPYFPTPNQVNTKDFSFNVLFYPTAGDDTVEYELGTITQDDLDTYGSTFPWSLALNSTTNPHTSAAWTVANITAGEFAIESVTGNPTITYHALRLNVVVSEGTCHLEQFAMDVCGVNSDPQANDGVVGFAKLYSTTNNHIKVTDDYNWTLADKTNSVAVTSPPNLPLDHAVLYGQVYLVNGIDATRRYPNGTNTFEALTTNNADGATKITGRTVMAFADRIVYGWVTDNTTVTPERCAYSKWQDGGTHADTTNSSAGDFDLLDTPGGVVKLAVLTEDFAAAYKRTGVYLLRRTGNSAAPIIRDVIDRITGCLAPMSVKSVVGQAGNTIHLFVGFNPIDGYNVYSFDGSQVQAVGNDIRPYLRDAMAMENLPSCFAEVDPQTGNYLLFLPLQQDSNTWDMFPRGGLMYNVRTNMWTTFTLPEPVSCAGSWNLSYEPPVIQGIPALILGKADGQLTKAQWNFAADAVAPSTQSRGGTTPVYGMSVDDGGEKGGYAVPFTATLQTGELDLSGPDNKQQSILQRLHITYVNVGRAALRVSASADGGTSFSATRIFSIGSDNAGTYGREFSTTLDFEPQVTAWKHTLKLEFIPQADGEETDSKPSPFALSEMILDYEFAGEMP